MGQNKLGVGGKAGSAAMSLCGDKKMKNKQKSVTNILRDIINDTVSMKQQNAI